jgi:hypothetical protein
MLTDDKGQAMQVRLEGRADDAVKFTLLADGTLHYYPIALLSALDQEFAHALPVTVTLGVPLDYVLTDPHGKGLPVRIDGHNSRWVKYTTSADQVTHYCLISTLATADQALVQLLPQEISFEYPLEYTFTDLQGNTKPVRILGHSEDVVKYAQVPDGAIQVVQIANLSPLDQEFVRQLPSVMTLNYPVDHMLTDSQGRSFQARILGRATGVIELELVADGTKQYLALSSLSEEDRKFVQQLPLNLSLHYPLEYTLTDQTGKTIPARLEAGDAELVKLTLLSDGSTHYYPISLLSDSDQKLLWQIPPARLNLTFPLECTLTDVTGRQIAARIEGRSSEAVKVTRLSDGTTHILPTSKLSLADQLFMKLMPMNLGNAELANSITKPTAVESAVVQNLLDRLAVLKQQSKDLEVQIADPSTMPNDRQFMQDKLMRVRAEVRSLTKEIQDAQTGGPPL